jgi:hypothetical protein
MSEFLKIIGGYFSLELPEKNEYHSRALRLNSARYCLEYVLCTRHYKKIYLPAYICDSVLQPIKRLRIDYAFYLIDEDLSPVFDGVPEKDTCFLYVNYFGLNDDIVRKICQSMKNVIVDNTQAFFAHPMPRIDTLYSPRKFFGVADGGYLYTNAEKHLELEPDPSYYRYDALLKQMDLGSTAAEPLFEQNEAYLDTCGMHAMSRVTQHLLRSIGYEQARIRRNKNFLFLHKQIGNHNQLSTDLSHLNGPLCYPFLIDHGEQLKDTLLNHHIYVNDYWEEVQSRVPSSSFEYQLAKNLVPLPIDQRYNESDMRTVIKVVQDFLE